MKKYTYALGGGIHRSWPGYDWFQELKQKGQMRDVIGPVRRPTNSEVWN